MSLVLAAYAILGVRVKGEGEYSGLALRLLHPDRVQSCIWVIFVWALARYCQRLYELGADTKRDVIGAVDAEDRRRPAYEV